MGDWEVCGYSQVVTDEDAVTMELLVLIGPSNALCSTVFNLWHAMGSRVFWSLFVHIIKPQYQLTTVKGCLCLENWKVTCQNLGELTKSPWNLKGNISTCSVLVFCWFCFGFNSTTQTWKDSH